MTIINVADVFDFQKKKQKHFFYTNLKANVVVISLFLLVTFCTRM